MIDNQGPTKTQVLIIGGGWTGVSAAKELQGLGITDFRILEAHPDRLGGRAFSYAYEPETIRTGPRSFEHGAQYIGVGQPAIWNLAKEHGYTVENGKLVDAVALRRGYPFAAFVLAGQRFVYDVDQALFDIKGVPPDIGVWEMLASCLLMTEIQAIEQSVDTVAPWSSPAWVRPLDGITVADWAGRKWIPPIARSLVEVAVQALLSVQTTELSALYFFWYCACNGGFLNEVNDDEGGPQQYYFATGVDALVNDVAAPFRDRIAFGSPVASIDAGCADGVLVTTLDGTRWLADKVIVATSPHTAGRIAYSPPLPDQRAALLRQGMGRTIKCQVFYDQPWWRSSNGIKLSGDAGGNDVPAMWVLDNSAEHSDPPLYCLMTFTVGACADALGPNASRDHIVETVTRCLASLFNDERALPGKGCFRDLVSYNWSESAAYSGGGPNTVFAPNLLTGPACPGAALNEPWLDRVFFASSESARKVDPQTSSPYWQPDPSDPTGPGIYSDMRQCLGYMDGAIVSGKYVAHQVSRSICGEPAVDNVRGDPGPVPPPLQPPAPPFPDFTPYPRATIRTFTAALCNAFYEGSKMDIDAWQKAKWTDAYADLLLLWVQEVVMKALVASGIDAGQMVNWENAIGSAYLYAHEDPATVPPGEEDVSRDIVGLTRVLDALLALRGVEPFLPASGQTAPPRQRPAMKLPRFHR